jgi:anthranilate phosphoribosyltransferase
MHGGGAFGERSYCYSTKYGLSLIEIWQGLGVDWTNLPLPTTQQVFEKTGIGFIHTPTLFPLTQTIWEYRDRLGKRPPLATMELIWYPYAGYAHIIAGFVHPRTEAMF